MVRVLACNMIKQYGTNACGLFALAYAMAICEENDPAKLIFQQISMRNHFNKIMRTTEIEQF